MSTTTQSAHAGKQDIERAVRTQLYRQMLRARQFEQMASDLFLQNLVKGTNHLALGQEAVAAGFACAMEERDYSFCTYRGHTHTLLRGANMAALFGELMGRSCGCLAGKGGSMHLTSAEHRAMGSYAIIGAQLCIANGTAWSSQYQGKDEVTVVFFGDGTTNIGAFHEALNLAVVWNLPIVFVCENNLYMEYTAIGEVTAVEHPAADRAAAYRLGRNIVDGNDADSVYGMASELIGRARRGEGPGLIEAMTYRHQGHSRADPAKYRPEGELESWMEKDPVKCYRQRLLESDWDEVELTALEKEVDEEVEQAVEEAKASPTPELDLCFKDVWADGGIAWRN